MKHLVLAVAFAAAALPAQAPKKAANAPARVNAVADEYLAEYFKTNPSAATQAGIPGARNDLLEDNSLAAERAWNAKADRWLTALQAINPVSLRGTQDGITYGLLIENLLASRQSRICRRELEPSGWASSYSNLVTIQPVGTSELRRATLARWAGLSHFVDVDIANSRRGLALDGLLALPIERSPFMNPAARDSTPGFHASLDSLVRASVIPTLERYRDFLTTEYLPAAHEAVSISANPNGAAGRYSVVRKSR
jgi:uncharacterized protein (DUF885 family)